MDVAAGQNKIPLRFWRKGYAVQIKACTSSRVNDETIHGKLVVGRIVIGQMGCAAIGSKIKRVNPYAKHDRGGLGGAQGKGFVEDQPAV